MVRMGCDRRSRDELRRAIEALQERLTGLSEASLRINRSLDLQTVLKEVLEGARELTGARCGAIATLDESGCPEDMLTSGLSRRERESMRAFPDGAEVFEYLGAMREPLRVRDLASHLRAQGFGDFRPPLAATSFLGTPMHHRELRTGSFFLAGKEGAAEFGKEDEETLVTFASQAALVIANARRHRDERRARADLEALISTSPVGVAVIDARSGVPVSFNREAARIVGDLQEHGRPPERLLEILTFRRADGRRISLEEFPLAQVLSTGETVLAEEMVLEVPDGRSVRVLLNATPIYSDEGEVESVVVTMQDMTPLEELERLRAEFVGMVSHELRTPLTSIRGSAATLIELLSGRDSAEIVQLVRIIEGQAGRMRDLINDLLDVAHIETGTLSVEAEPADLAVLVDDARNTFLSSGGRENIRIELPPDLPYVMADGRRIVQVLGNLLSNAARHSPASSVITVSAAVEGVHVAVAVTDESRGISADRLPHLFRKFSRIRRDDWVSDTGLGLAICREIVEAHGGRIRAGRARARASALASPSRFRWRTRAARRMSLPARRKVLTVDDDPQTLRYVRDILSKAGYAPVMTADPQDVSRLMREEAPHLVLLDLMLPGTNGMELMEEILNTGDVPVIFLSAYGQDETIAGAFEAGAADYVVKPFSATELVARIGAALRKWTPGLGRQPEPFVLGDLIIDYAVRSVRVSGRTVRLTSTEYDLLRELSVNAGRVLTHEHLLRMVWGQEHASGSTATRTAVRRLRRKLGDDARNPIYIFAEPRVGYRMPRADTAGP